MTLEYTLTPHFDYKKYIEQDPDCKESDIEELHEWCANQAPGSVIPRNLPKHRIFQFYYASNCNVENTKKRIKAYYTQAKKSPDFFDNRYIEHESLKKSLDYMNTCMLPEKTKDGHAILYTSINQASTGPLDTSANSKLAIMVLEKILYECGAIGGVVYVMDGKGIGLSHSLKTNLGAVKRFYDFVDLAIPLRFRAIYIINHTPTQKKLMTIFNPMMSHPIFGKMVKIYTEDETELFHKEGIPKEIMPAHFGGSNYEIRSLVSKNAEVFAKMRPYFDEEERMRKAAYAKSK